ncbi:MAG: phosphoheptose isomerase [Chloroflexi bacterium]|nr:phosphoheptose isomerase [Chloroflexota bacterium]|tara:strand:- start:40 stop:600 length:561 start_codon:yes stop_codon:yes gene_type:complete
MKNLIEESIISRIDIVQNSTSLSSEIEESIQKIIECLKNQKKIVLFGNGGSAADAQHIAAEFIGRFKKERNSLPAISLTTDTSIITSISNDYSFDNIFSRQCESLVNSGDVVIAISTSGNSKNIELGIKASKQNGALIIGLLGNNGGMIRELVDIPIIINSTDTPKIQEMHRIIYHIICDLVEKNL